MYSFEMIPAIDIPAGTKLEAVFDPADASIKLYLKGPHGGPNVPAPISTGPLLVSSQLPQSFIAKLPRGLGKSFIVWDEEYLDRPDFKRPDSNQSAEGPPAQTWRDRPPLL